jgi:uncharacterized protein (TIGR00369 family)
MSALDTERLAIISERLLASPVAQALALSIQDAQPGLIKLAMPFNVGNVTKGSLIHGGVIATLADVAAVASAVSAARDAPTGGATVNLSISYIRPANGCELLAIAQVRKAGGRQHFVNVEVTNADGQLIAEALVTIMLS